MKREDYNYAKSIYEKMFWMQIFKPEEMKQAYRCLFGSEAANVQQARARVAAYFRYDTKPVFDDEIDKTETAFPKDSTSLSTPESTELSTHSEDETMDTITEMDDIAQEFIDDVKESQWLDIDKIPVSDDIETQEEFNEILKEFEKEEFATNLELVTKPKSTELSTHTEDESFTKPTNLELVTKIKSNGRKKSTREKA